MNGLNEEIHSGYSVKNTHHAEQDLMTKTGGWGGNFLTMYVDIEPCSNGRYKGHPVGCATLIVNAFGAGNVWYGFSENEYTRGDVLKYLKDSDKQDQIIKLSSVTGHKL